MIVFLIELKVKRCASKLEIILIAMKNFFDLFFNFAVSNWRFLIKKRYTFSSGDSFEADLDDLKRLLAENQQYVENYEDVLGSLYDDEYVARGNGFCDRKYSDDFVESQLEKYQKRVEELKNWINVETS